MKHWMIYLIMGLVIVLTGQLPFQDHDVGTLRPVEVVLARLENGKVCLSTDTGDKGKGDTWEEALDDMKERAPGSIFLGTAGFLLIEDREILPEVMKQDLFNPSCGICYVEDAVDLTDVGTYLRANEPEANLRLIRTGEVELPILRTEDGGYRLDP